MRLFQIRQQFAADGLVHRVQHVGHGRDAAGLRHGAGLFHAELGVQNFHDFFRDLDRRGGQRGEPFNRQFALFRREQVQNLRGFFRRKMADDKRDGLHLLVADEVENVARIHVGDDLHRAERRARGGDAAHHVAGLELAERLFERVPRDFRAGGNGRAGGDAPRRKIPRRISLLLLARDQGEPRHLARDGLDFARLELLQNHRGAFRAEHDQQRGELLHLVQAAGFGGGFRHGFGMAVMI